MAAGGAAGDNYIGFGVAFDNGPTVGVFNDPPLAFAGVNGSGDLDLITSVTGRIVVVGTTNQGLTDSISVLTGSAAQRNLLLQAFDIHGNLVGSVTNPGDGVTTFGVTAPGGAFEIASFSVSTPADDTFGVRSITLDTPISAAVPEPSSLALCGIGLAAAIRHGVRRRQKAATA